MTWHHSGFGVFTTLESEQLRLKYTSGATGNDRNCTTLITIGAVTVGASGAEYLDLQ